MILDAMDFMQWFITVAYKWYPEVQRALYSFLNVLQNQ